MSEPYRNCAPESLLDREMHDFICEVAAVAAKYPDPMSLPVVHARDVVDATLRPFAEGGPTVEHIVEQTVTLGDQSLNVRRYLPPEARGPLLVYIHGGGWTWESIDTHDRMAREYATRTGFPLLALDYPLAPEHPFPVAADLIMNFLRRIHNEAREWGTEDGILLIGDSAGANLTLSACLRLDCSEALPKAMLLNYGAYCRQLDQPSYDWIETSALGPKRAQIAWFWEKYAGQRDSADREAEPLHSSLKSLPPIRLQIAQLDVLHDENLALAIAASKAGTEVECEVFNGVTHGFLRAVGRVSTADRAFAAGCQFLVTRSSQSTWPETPCTNPRHKLNVLRNSSFGGKL